jgi:hypothetical protein
LVVVVHLVEVTLDDFLDAILVLMVMILVVVDNLVNLYE